MTKTNVARLFRFIRERHTVYERKTANMPKPWTKDKILQSYRFCNVYRELDKVTVWIRKNWREPNHLDTHLWFAMVVARLLNLPESLEAIGYPVPWDKTKFKSILRKRKMSGETVFSGAYMIHADAKEGWLKTDYLAECVLNPMWEKKIPIHRNMRLSQLHTLLMDYRDMGSFMAGQVVADTKFGHWLQSSPDWWTFAAPGPGSMRGLSRVEFGDLGTAYTEAEWQDSLGDLQIKIDKLVREEGMPRISAQDLQNCLCEFDKYERVRLGQGRPKQLYKGAA